MTDEEDHILLLRAAGNIWLVEGERHMQGMLTNMEPFPKPVRCISFETRAELAAFLPKGFSIEKFWSIHPEIVARLETEGHLVELQRVDDDDD